MTSREPRVRFKVIECSSFDDKRSSALALEQVNPHSQGWISAPFAGYPQQITLELERPVRIKQIQILSHECLIATRIELYIGLQSTGLTRLGYMSLDPNKRSAYKARELKTVDLQIQTDAKFVQMVIHEHHENENNPLAQVGLIAVNILGERVSKTNPADISVDVECDPQTARLLRALHEQKKIAVEEEDFDKAKELKQKIESLRSIGLRLANLEVEKRAAVGREDYDHAKLIKEKMDEIRRDHTIQRTAVPVAVTSGKEQLRSASPAKHVTPIVVAQIQPGHTDESQEEKKKALPYDDRPLPAQKKHLHDPEEPLNPFGDRNNQVEETAPADSPDLSISDPAPLSDSEKLQHAPLIKAFGEQVVTLLLSKKAFQHRVNALDDVEGILSGLTSASEAYFDLVSNALNAVGITLLDGLCQVSVRAMCLIETLLNKVFQNMDLNEIQECMDPIMPSLLSLLDGSLGRQRDKARHIFDILVKYPSVIGRYVTKPLKNNDAYKPLQGRVELLTVLVEMHGLSEENSLRLDQIMSYFSLPALRHKRSSIRQAGIDLTVALHNCVGDDVLLPYLEGVVNSKLESTLRKTFMEKQLFHNQYQSNGSTQSSISVPALRSISPTAMNHRRGSPAHRSRENANGMHPAAAHNGSHMESSHSSHKQYDDIEDESICRFCGRHDPEFTQEEVLDLHYWMACPMLVSCKLCEQVVEIPTLVDHLLNECEKAAEVFLCKDCRRPLCGSSEINDHENNCPGSQSDIGDSNQCPLCFSIIGPGEDGWREHLLEGSGCEANTRQTQP